MAAASLVGCITDPLEPSETTRTHNPTVAGTGYTTFDTLQGGCSNTADPDRITCNAYRGMEHVFISAGPDQPSGGLANGAYFFAVLAPGSQLATFLDRDGVDPVSNRTFVVEDHEIVAYAGTHPIGQTPDGRLAIGLAPFEHTEDAGGVYILAICAADASDPAQCKYDAFRIRDDSYGRQFPLVHGGTYYDANLNGRWELGTEPGIAGWIIGYHDAISATVETGADGQFALELIPDGYLVVARDATNTAALGSGETTPVWFQTGHADPVPTEGGAYANRNADHTYWIEVDDNQVVRDLSFGFVCIDESGTVQPSPATCPLATF